MNNLDLQKEYSDINSMFMARIELTTRCNWRCKQCYIDNYNEYGLKKEEIFCILDKMREFGVTQLDEMAVEGISTTLFSMSDEINDRITGSKNSASIIINNLKKLSKTKLSVEVKTILMKENIDEYHEIQHFCEKYGFDYLVTEGLFPTNDGSNVPRNLAVTCEQLRENLLELDINRYGSIYKKQKNANDPICTEIKYSMSIAADGECYPCNLLHKKLGNIRDYNYDVSLVWNHDFLEKLRNKTWKDLKKCFSCDKNEYCVRCTGIVDTINGDMFQDDPFSCRTANIRRLLDVNNNHM